jgi:hypothetical protein
MSRAYRIRVSESLQKVIRAEDHVSTQLEILGVLPPEELTELLRAELERRGFREQGGQLVREQEGIEVLVDPDEGTVTVQTAGEEVVDLKEDVETWTYDQDVKRAQHAHQEKARRRLEKEAVRKEATLQRQVTDQLEAQLGDLRQELNQVANQVTAAALKRKAAQMGQIKQVNEDPQSGSMTIVVEV